MIYHQLMKKLTTILFLFLSLNSFADLHLQVGEVEKVHVNGCKISEYGVVSTNSKFNEGDVITAKCLPKLCVYHSPALLGTPIYLRPGDKLLANTNSRAETKAYLDSFLKNGVCAELRAITPQI